MKYISLLSNPLFISLTFTLVLLTTIIVVFFGVKQKDEQDAAKDYKISLHDLIEEQNLRDSLILSELPKDTTQQYSQLNDFLMEEELNLIVFAKIDGCSPCYINFLGKVYSLFKELNVIVVTNQIVINDDLLVLYNLGYFSKTIQDEKHILFDQFKIADDQSAALVIDKNKVMDCFYPRATQPERMTDFILKVKRYANN